VLYLPDAEITSRLFAFLDCNNNGHINFREYITGTVRIHGESAKTGGD
jgi:hypothetical protein